jgi:hypothetical protein
MKKKTTYLAFIIFLTALQLSAQCRLVRVDFSDTSNTIYYSYDTEGRLSMLKENGVYKGTIYRSEFHYAYNEKGKLLTIRRLDNDTLSLIRDLIYDNDIVKQIYTAYPLDTMTTIGFLTYNEKGQVIRYYGKSSKGDTLTFSYEYAPEGWLKRYTHLHTQIESCGRVDIRWDANQKIADDPMRLFFAGCPINNYWYIPVEPLSVKGNAKGYTRYSMDKDGHFVTKVEEGEVFDIKANAEGLWTENKFRNMMENKVITAYAFYEGCKN